MITPFTREPTEKCNRCGLEYKISESICPHCAGKTNDQIIRDVHIPRSHQLRKTNEMARYFIYFSIILACLLPLLW